MRSTNLLRRGSRLMAAVCLAAFVSMLVLSTGYRKKTPAYAGGAQVISTVKASIDGQTQEVTLPHSFTDLAPRTPVTLTVPIRVNANDSIYLKTVYAPLRAYVNDILVYECGQEGSQPPFMSDPATTVTIVPLTGIHGSAVLRLEYQSPISRSTLTVHPPLVGQEAALTRSLLSVLGFSFVFSVVEIFCGLLLILIAFFVLIFERRGLSLLWLGLFALAGGFWAFGECNFSGFFISNSTVLYLLDFTGLFLLPLPLVQFCLSMIDFRNPRPLQIITLFDLTAVAAALLLQLSGLVALSRSMYVFHILLPLTLAALAFHILYEYLHYHNRGARRFFAPMAVLALFALLETLNYQLRFTNVLSMLFQIGVLLFILMMGLIGGLFVRDAIQARQEQQRLSYEVQLLDRNIADQKRQQTMLLQNMAKVREQRHDLRHQLAVIRAFSQEGSNQRLTAYLDALGAQIPDESETLYCENAAVNAIISHYAGMAKQQNIELDIRLAVPAATEQITDSSLCVIFGNLLENAIEACARMTDGRRFIRLSSRLQYETLTIVMDNSFDGTVHQDESGLLSSKRDGHGIGTASVRAVAAQNGGGAEFRADGRVFLSSVYVRI